MSLEWQEEPELPSYLARLRQAILNLPENSTAGRRQIYKAFERELLDHQKRLSTFPLDSEQDFEFRMLRQTIRYLEQDIIAGVDITAPGYFPDGLVEIRRRLLISRARGAVATTDQEQILAGAREDTSPANSLDSCLWQMLACLDTRNEEKDRKHHRPVDSLWALRALLIYQFQLIAGESRVAIVWMLVQPAVLLALISMMYFVIGTNRVLNMDVPTFALLGAGTWIMCRQVIFRISTQIAHHRFLINFPTVSPLMQGLTQGILYLLIYTVSLIVLIAAGRSIDMTSLPDHPLMVGAYGIGMWFFAVSVGFIFGGIAIFWPYFLRFATVLERAIQLFSSVAFVSEQLPEEYRGWLTWSPTSHGLQLMRSFYFDSYPSVDASASYFWTAILFLTCGAFLFERLVRPYMQPI